MKPDHLVRAGRLARQGNYDGAIKLLEAEINRYHNSFSYYYLLASSYLYSEVYGMAYTYFDLARKIRLRDSSTLLGLAAICLNSGDTDRAVDLYLEVQDQDEDNHIARKALAIIRKYPGPENISAWVDSGNLRKLFPPLPKAPPEKGKVVFLAAAFVLIAAGGFFIANSLLHGSLIPGIGGPPRENPGGIELLKEDRNAPMQVEGSFRYVLTRDEVIDDYNSARRFFSTYNDEKARMRLNRILESNGPEPVKNKARILLSYLEVPGFDTLKDRFTYSEVNADTSLYRNCHVIWRGTATNLNTEQNHTSFDFLVGYDTRRTLEGIVRVDFGFAVAVNPERPLEVLGRIVPAAAENGPGIRIEGIALNQAGILEHNQNVPTENQNK